MKQKIKIEGKNISDIFNLPCLHAIMKMKNAYGDFQVVIHKNGRLDYASVGDWLVEDESGNWSVEKK